MNPTDPMTSVRALIEAAGKADEGPWILDWPGNYGIACHAGRSLVCTGSTVSTKGTNSMHFIVSARAATASISQLLSEHDKVVEYIKELRESSRMRALRVLGPAYEATDKGIAESEKSCADCLQYIVEGK